MYFTTRNYEEGVSCVLYKKGGDGWGVGERRGVHEAVSNRAIQVGEQIVVETRVSRAW